MWQSPKKKGNGLIVDQNNSKIQGIPTPVCALARNDIVFRQSVRRSGRSASFYSCLLSAAAAVVIVVAAVAAVGAAAAAAVAEEQDQNDDPPPIVVQAAADTVVIAHTMTSVFNFLRDSPLNPCYSTGSLLCSK